MLYIALILLVASVVCLFSKPAQIEEPHHDSMPYSHYSISHRKEKTNN